MGFSEDFKPKLRWPLDLQPITHEGNKYILLRDRNSIAPGPAMVPQPFMPIVARFDGTRTLQEIAAEGAAWGVTIELLNAIAGELDNMSFLETAESLAKHREIFDAFLNTRVRPAAHAGGVYPEDPTQLNAAIEEYLSRYRHGKPRTVQSTVQSAHLTVGVMCPHIDYQRGWHSYSATYDALDGCSVPDVIVLIGTSHQPGEGSFHLTRKDFETPLGVFESATDCVNDLVNGYGSSRSLASEFLHKSEHSLELQLPFLAHRFRGQKLPKIVPILVGSFHDYVEAGNSPKSEGEVADFIGHLADGLRKLKASGQQVWVWSGVDLAHVGLHFGDASRISDSELGLIEQRDLALIDCLLRSDEEGLFAHIAEDLDRRRICGFPSLYTKLAAMKAAGMHCTGRLNEYRQAVEPRTDCVVTFASISWFTA